MAVIYRGMTSIVFWYVVKRGLKVMIDRYFQAANNLFKPLFHWHVIRFALYTTALQQTSFNNSEKHDLKSVLCYLTLC